MVLSEDKRQLIETTQAAVKKNPEYNKWLGGIGQCLVWDDKNDKYLLSDEINKLR